MSKKQGQMWSPFRSGVFAGNRLALPRMRLVFGSQHLVLLSIFPYLVLPIRQEYTMVDAA